MGFDYKKFRPDVAYFSMGAYFESFMPTYSGGLEVLAGDTFRSCADLRIPLVGVIQASSNGYFRQTIDENGAQIAQPVYWAPHKTLHRIPEHVTIKHKRRDLRVGAEIYEIVGETEFKLPVFLLDTNFDANHEDDKVITGMLYDASPEQRIAQENVLGQAGVKLINEIGYDSINTFHMNEGHACFAALELLAEKGYDDTHVKDHCVFTTHTPVPAGHSVWGYELLRRIVGNDFLPWHIHKLAGEGNFNTTKLALNLSRYTNAVSKRHAAVCEAMDVFQGRRIPYITNGIHPKTWAVPPMAGLYDNNLKHWKIDPKVFEDAIESIPPQEIISAKNRAKRYLIGFINTTNPVKFDLDVLTIVWARRFTSYKRPLLIFRDIDRLNSLAEEYGGIQILFAGKSHPADEEGKKLIQQVNQTAKSLKDNVSCAFIEGYDAKTARRLLGGADVWLNTPRRPLEASGTSGMKAALNACLNLSTYDGWSVEAYEMDPESVWIVGPKSDQVRVNPGADEEDRVDAESLYDSLEQILEIFYNNKEELARRIAHSIRLVSHFNTHRMVQEYAAKAWNIAM